MILKQEVIERIKGRRAQKRIAEKLGVSQMYVSILLRENKPNNRLTLYSSLEIISCELDMPVSELLEVEHLEEAVK